MTHHHTSVRETMANWLHRANERELGIARISSAWYGLDISKHHL